VSDHRWAENAERVLTSGMTLAAILAGFLSVALSVTFNLPEVVRRLKTSGQYEDSVGSLRSAVFSCGIAAVVALVLLLALPQVPASGETSGDEASVFWWFGLLFAVVSGFAFGSTTRLWGIWVAALKYHQTFAG